MHIEEIDGLKTRAKAKTKQKAMHVNEGNKKDRIGALMRMSRFCGAEIKCRIAE